MNPEPVDRIDAPSPESFASLLQHPLRPVVVTGVVDQWPAWQRWTWDHLVRSAAEVSVEAAIDGGAVSVRTPTETIRLAEHLRALAEGDAVDHYVSALPVTRVPALVGDLDFERLLGPIRYSGPNLWVGASANRTRLHFDAVHGCLAMLRGQKKIVLFSPDTPFSTIRPHPLYSRSPNWSRVRDIESAFAETPRFAVLLEPGELLLIPVHWWHAVEGVGANIAANVWFSASIGHYLRSPFGWRSAVHELVKRRPLLDRLRTAPSDL